MSGPLDDDGVDQTSEPPGPADMALPDLPPLPDDAPLPEEPPDDDHHGPRAWSTDRGSRSANRSSGARVPPHNLDAEASLLGAMLLSRDAIADALEVVNAEHFYKPSHGHVFEAICGLYASGEPADPVTVAEALTRSGLLDQIGGPGLLLELQASTPATSSAPSTPGSSRNTPLCGASSVRPTRSPRSATADPTTWSRPWTRPRAWCSRWVRDG